VPRHMRDVIGCKPVFGTFISQSVSFWFLRAVILMIRVFWKVML